MMHVDASTHPILAKQMQGVKERRARLGFNVTARNKETGRVDATVRPPKDDEKDERTYRRWALKDRKEIPEPKTFDEHVKDYRSFMVRFGGSPARAYVYLRFQEMCLPYLAIVGPTRMRHIVVARQRLMWDVKHRFNLTLNEIARIFGGKDHTTVLHALRRVQALIDARQIKNPLTGEFEPKEGAADGP